MINNYYSNTFNVAQLQGQADKVKALQDNLLNSATKDVNKTAESKKEAGDKKLLEASQQFESVFINQVLQEMDKTIERSELMHGGAGEEMFRGLFYQEIAKNIATSPSANFGLGRQIYEQLSKYQ